MTPQYKIVFAAFLFLVVSTASAQKPATLKSHKTTVSGTSTLHDWTSDVTKLTWKGALTVQGGKLTEVKDVVITIPVTSIKSTKGKTMDNKTYEAFKSDKNPSITYTITEASIQGSKVDTKGTLSMAGASKQITLSATLKVLPSGDVQFTGSHKIVMPEYKMDPPTAVMGTIKVGPDVTVNFDLTITPTK
jgi:polyisoprenoid-binding protein YceI